MCTSASGQKITNAQAPAMAMATKSRAKNRIMAEVIRMDSRDSSSRVALERASGHQNSALPGARG